MVQRICNHAALLVLGMFAGVVVAGGWFGLRQGTLVRATATHGQDNFAIATGFVDKGIEAFYFLDFLTGDLRAAIVSRRTAEFVAFIERNIQADFNTDVSQNPKYLMVTGMADIPRGRGATQIGNSLVYVAEASSGQVNAYALPWNSTLNAKGETQRGQFLQVASGTFRTTFIRDTE